MRSSVRIPSALSCGVAFYRRPTAIAIGVTMLLASGLIVSPPLQASASAAPSISVSGNHLVDADGNVLQLRGVNRSGAEYACAEGWGIWDGPTDDDTSIAAMLTWKINAVRIPLNEDCWLAINGINPQYSGANYINAIVDYVNRLNAHGIIAMPNLHFSAPGSTVPDGQSPMADRDHSNAFWSSVAATFKDNHSVLFDLFNEPYPDNNQDTTAAWTCNLNGGTCSGVSFTAAGMQEMVNAVRNTGATQPLLIGGPQYAGVVDHWTQYKPTDPLNQLVASIHIYGLPLDSPCRLQDCWDSDMAPLATTTPIVIGEFGDTDCTSNFSPPLLTWADAHGISYLAWAWNTAKCAADPALISDYTGTPTAYGVGVRDHYLAVAAAQASCTATSVATTAAGSGSTTFYFAEGFTGSGFSECLAIFMPTTTGQATIDYWTATTHTIGLVNVTAGKVSTVNVNAVVGPNQQVSVKVTLPGPGVVERLLHFNFGNWHGSTDIVGTPAPNSEWDFAEGSTLSFFSEYLTLQNPNSVAVPATLTYMTDSGAHPTKTLSLNPNSRTTVEVFNGDPVSNLASCIPSGAGANCGVGPGIGGVSVRVTTPAGEPIVAERPFYVNGFGFGFAPNHDGHVAFGANAPASHWYFAEGTTILSGSSGFNEYLTLQNPSSTDAAHVTLRYVDQSGTVTLRTPTVNPQSRLTIEVFNSLYGVGRGIGGVSTEITSDTPIVAERPMYISWDFGAGRVNGATDVLGATATRTLFGFAALTTAPGHNDYLTLQNPGDSAASVTIDYYTGSGKVSRAMTVNAHSRLTVQVFDATNGVGVGQDVLGAVITSTNAVPILVEKPTYGAVSSAYGATDTMAYSTTSF